MNLIYKTIGAALCLALSVAVAAQQDRETPRTPDGQPDLQGVWTNSSQTPLVRPEEFGAKGFLTQEEAQDVEQGWRDRYDLLAQPINPERGPPTDGNADFGYNSFWWDPRDDAIELNGEFRTSIIIDPPDGQIPFVEGGAPGHDLRTAWRDRPGVEAFDDYPLRPLAERCLLTFGSGAGPPMLPILYNSNYQIVQTPDYVMILVEMVHDARIIRLDERHQENDFDKWMGDSVGYWDGNVLKVESRDFHPQQSFRGSSNEVVIHEEFELLGPEKIRYSFTIDDPLTYTQPWTGEVAMNRKAREERMYEYACHEGNYAFAGILAGARRQELEAELQP